MAELRRYVEQEVLGASPQKAVLLLYERAICGCLRRDERLASAALAQLIDALDLRYEVAQGLFRLYDWCLRLVKRGQFEAAREILQELRDAWRRAMGGDDGDHALVGQGAAAAS